MYGDEWLRATSEPPSVMKPTSPGGLCRFGGGRVGKELVLWVGGGEREQEGWLMQV
jgi:hypothetical protein